MANIQLTDRPDNNPPVVARDWVDREKRTVTTLFVGRLSINDQTATLCRIRNLSPGGMMLETPAELKSGDCVSVELRNGDVLKGGIVWTRPGKAGVQFHQPIDMDQLLTTPMNRRSSPQAPHPRAPRFDVHSPARIRGGGRVLQAIVENLSQSGALVRLREPHALAGSLMIEIEGLAPRGCAIRWIHEDLIGIAFLDLVTFDEFTTWLNSHQAVHPDQATRN